MDGDVVDRLFAALTSGELDVAKACLAADAAVWHCFDGLAQDRAAAVAGWQALVDNFAERAFVDVRRWPIAGGFVQQHLLAVRNRAGKAMAWPCCLVIQLEGGLISRIDEYLDRAGHFDLAELVAARAPGLTGNLKIQA